MTDEDGPPFDINIFRQYLQYTYMACEQVEGVETLDVAWVGPLVLAANTQMHEGFLSLHNNPDKYFKFYSLLIHIVLFYG